ncbi:exoribonuclease, putative [Plasmodium berghei]|uniref:Exoribonuclease, putative n=2 Tax=Plasmodium berghei TaxID=5821 RepID=A0A509APD8_PLABA|nr:exoribonuclease, putative [Plasmodium berghei ANKA]CXJ01863.1 exoribonuclease, putative [Plasmodium berghei]SCL98231.1 exoribonuclease, putative [Plasmodium berghei]SCM16784.1 exoribonuclease, putative [Plasmodium berghei]SCM18582.1 exoribonuclease, putative [Plasmodium berghei]SCN28016.1 exoribonuclease, putative [Plasmodium berghei]|eukprot:XP_034423668.1 exoribonuclease, putative [Plasmodium berghei ANKA]
MKKKRKCGKNGHNGNKNTGGELRNVKRKIDEENNTKLEVSFYGHRNILLKDIQNFIINLRINKNILKNNIFQIKNNENLTNLIIMIIPNLSCTYIRDITTDNVFNKLQKNNNFRKMQLEENCVKSSYSNIIAKMLNIPVFKNKEKTNNVVNFNIENFLLTKEQMFLNRYPNSDSVNYINFDNIDYKKKKKKISDIKNYLFSSVNSVYISTHEPNFEPNNSENISADAHTPNGNTIHDTTSKTNYVKKKTFTDEHIEIYAKILEKLINTSSSIRLEKTNRQLSSKPKVDYQNNKRKSDEIKENVDGNSKIIRNTLLNDCKIDENTEMISNGNNEDMANQNNKADLICDKESEETIYDNIIDVENHEHKIETILKTESNQESNTNKFEFDLNNIFSVDCEMCETSGGYRELTKVTIVDAYMNIIYDSYVLPDNKITNYLTLYSGINENTLKNVHTKLTDVQKELKNILNNKSILVGHSLENDLHALKIKHDYIIDTSVIYSNNNYNFLKPSLFNLSKKHLNITMERENGHNSIDDARISMFLALKKISEFDNSETYYGFHPLPLFMEKNNYLNVKSNFISEQDINSKYNKNMCIYDSKNIYIEEKFSKYIMRNCFYCPCEDDEECIENLINNIKNENKIKNYILILREYENLCNAKIYNCVKNSNNKSFNIEDNEKFFDIPTRVETNDILNKLSKNIEFVYNNMKEHDVLILLSYSNNYLAIEKIKDTLNLAKEIFYSDIINIDDKIKYLNEKIQNFQKHIQNKKENKEIVDKNSFFLEFKHLLFTYDLHILNYLYQHKNSDKNAYIMNSITNLKNTLCFNTKKKNYNGWFSLLLKN